MALSQIYPTLCIMMPLNPCIGAICQPLGCGLLSSPLSRYRGPVTEPQPACWWTNITYCNHVLLKLPKSPVLRVTFTVSNLKRHFYFIFSEAEFSMPVTCPQIYQ